MIVENGGARTLEIYFNNGKTISLHLDDDEQCKIVDNKLFVNAGYDKVSTGFNLDVIGGFLLCGEDDEDNTED